MLEYGSYFFSYIKLFDLGSILYSRINYVCLESLLGVESIWRHVRSAAGFLLFQQDEHHLFVVSLRSAVILALRLYVFSFNFQHSHLYALYNLLWLNIWCAIHSFNMYHLPTPEIKCLCSEC